MACGGVAVGWGVYSRAWLWGIGGSRQDVAAGMGPAGVWVGVACGRGYGAGCAERFED